VRRTALSALVAVALFAAPVFAQDATGEPATIDALVVDYSTMLAAREAGGPGPAVPLRDVNVRLVMRGRGMPTTVEARTDGDGRLRAELPDAGSGTIVEILVSPDGSEADDPGFYAQPWEVSRGPAPDEVRCFRVTTDPRVLRIGTLRHSLVRQDDEGIAQLQTLANVVNVDAGFHVFRGVADPESGQGGVPIAIPAGFELNVATIDGAPAKPNVAQAPHGGRAFTFAGTIFPATRGNLMDKRVQLRSTAPYESGQRYDFSFHSDIWIGRYILSVQESAFHVTQPDAAAVKIYDAGVEDVQGGQKTNRLFVTEDVAAHTDVAITVHGGTPFPVRAVITTAVIALMVLGGAFLGLAMRRSAGAEPVERATPDAAAPAGARPGELERIEKRFARREITSVEYEIRRKSLAGRVAAATAPKAVKASIETADGDESPLDTVGRIEGRAGVATKEQLREDVHMLARLVRRLLDR